MRYCNTQTVSVYRKTALILKLFPLHGMRIGKIKTQFKQLIFFYNGNYVEINIIFYRKREEASTPAASPIILVPVGSLSKWYPGSRMTHFLIC